MQFYFIRHGQSVNNLLWDETGTNAGRSSDPELTPAGRKQAEILGDFLARTDPEVVVADTRDSHNIRGFYLTHIYTSLMIRAVDTAVPIANKCNLPLQALAEVHEEGGIYMENEKGEFIPQAGNTRAYYQEHYPGVVLPDAVTDAGWWNRPFETPEERPARAERFLHDLLERHGQGDDHVAVVSHGGFYNLLLVAILKLQDRSHLWFPLNNAAITRIDFEGDHVRPTYTNRVDFQPAELIT